jgi:hypothetical protein
LRAFCLSTIGWVLEPFKNLKIKTVGNLVLGLSGNIGTKMSLKLIINIVTKKKEKTCSLLIKINLSSAKTNKQTNKQTKNVKSKLVVYNCYSLFYWEQLQVHASIY